MADSNETDIPTLDALARRYLDLWQDQWVAVAGDPVTAENITRWFQIMAQGTAAFLPFAGLATGGAWDTRPSPRTATGFASESPQSRPAEESSWPPPPLPPIFRLWPPGALGATDDREGTAGAATAGTALGGDVDGASEFAGRLAVLEERLVVLEAGAARPRFRSRRPNRGGGS